MASVYHRTEALAGEPASIFVTTIGQLSWPMVMWLMAMLAAGVAKQGAPAHHTSPGCLHRRPAGGGSHLGFCPALQQAVAAAKRCQETLQSPHPGASAIRYNAQLAPALCVVTPTGIGGHAPYPWSVYARICLDIRFYSALSVCLLAYG